MFHLFRQSIVLSILYSIPFIALCPSSIHAADIQNDIYHVGVAEVDITPKHPIRLNGFGGRRTESEGVNHPIHARALSIRHADDKQPVLLITVDVLGIPDTLRKEVVNRLKDLIPSDRLAITATHTHCGPMLKGANPTLFGVPIPDDHLKHIDEYTAVFLDKLEAVAREALKNPKPAKLNWGVGTVEFARNRRTSGGPTDHDLPVLIVRDVESNRVKAVYVTYACHCVTLSHNRIGGDWAGYAAEAIRNRFPDAIALVSVGCGADQNPDSGVTGGKVEVAELQGRQIAEEVKRLAAGFLAPVRGKPICTMKSMDLPLAKLPTRDEWNEKAKRKDAIGYHASVQLAKLNRNEKLIEKIDYPVQSWQFGDSLAMLHLPGEVVCDYSLRLKKELDRSRLWVTAYTNNNPCYIPSERVLKEGGYEGGGAMVYYDVPVPFKPGLEAIIINEVKSQVGKTFTPKFDSNKTNGTKPMSPQQSLREMKTAGPFVIDLVAAEPLVSDPVAMAFGPDGKLWVAEMLDYPSGKSGRFEPGGRIRVLEDRDRDGIMDQATTFVDGLPFPTGVLPWRKGVLICAAPDILYAEAPADGKGPAVVKKLFSGFGTDNYQARVNGLSFGLDGWVYGSCGLFGGNILSHKTGKTIALGDRDFRFKPDTGELEAATGRTQQGRVRNDWGDWFGCDNSNFAWQYVIDDHYLRRNPFVAPPRMTVNVPAGPDPNLVFPARNLQLFQLSGPAGRATAACGIGIYRDDRLGTDFTGNSFTCEPVNLLVHRRVLKPDGVIQRGDRAETERDREFLTSTDGWFRPVQAASGPDGSLWIADMYRFIIEHPRWIPPADLAKLDPRAGAGLGRIYRVRNANTKPAAWPRLSELNTVSLVAAVDSANGWQRDMATELLVWRGDQIANPQLFLLAKHSKRPETRLHALVALDRLNGLTPTIVLSALNDPHPGVRRHAVRFSEPFLNKSDEFSEALSALANDSDPRVRLQVALSLGESTRTSAGKLLAQMLAANEKDPYFVAAVFCSLNKGNFQSFVERPEVASRIGTSILPKIIATAIGLNDERVIESSLKLITKREKGTYQAWQFTTLESVIDAWNRATVHKPFPESVNDMLSAARSVAVDEKSKLPERVAAVALLGREAKQADSDVKLLSKLLSPQTPITLQTAAIQVLGRIADDKAAEAILAGWSGYTPTVRNRALGYLLDRPSRVLQVLTAIGDNRLTASSISPGQRQGLLTNPDPVIRKKAEAVFAGATNRNRQQVIDDYRQKLPTTGDATKGLVTFQKICSSCHQLEGVGHVVGPDLAALANKSSEYLLAEILDPNRNLDNRYLEYVAHTADGRVLNGLLANESTAAVTLKQADGKETTLLRADLESLKSTGRSLMPEGLEKDISPTAMADLFAFLSRNRTPAKSFPGNMPATVSMVKGQVVLAARQAEIRGEQIAFETDFGNIGFWSGAKDTATWRMKLDKADEFDVYLDYACDPSAAGNPFAIDGGTPTLRGKIEKTNGWSDYRWVKVGTVRLPAGETQLTVRPDSDTVRGALADLRTVILVVKGNKPEFTGKK